MSIVWFGFPNISGCRLKGPAASPLLTKRPDCGTVCGTRDSVVNVTLVVPWRDPKWEGRH